MANKYLQPSSSTLYKNKISQLSNTLQTSLSSEDFFASEHYFEEAIRILTSFYETLDEPIRDEELLPVAGDLPKNDDFNKTFEIIRSNLEIVFAEFENLEDLLLQNFNFAVTNSNRLKSRIKKVASLVADFSLYSELNTGIFLFKDSFNDTSKIDLNTALLNEKQCNINDAEGVVTLPLDLSKDSLIPLTILPIINPSSNGVVGNNFESGKNWNGDSAALLDGNPDTWFEYEKVVSSAEDDGNPLVLDITINLGESRILNWVRINPNNFGTRTAIAIETIETSIDGQSFLNVKDDIPIPGYITEDEDNIFLLAPHTSKYEGQGIFTFTPRKAKFIHFILKQREPYTIETSTGTKLRYAIGIRDFEFRSIAFHPKGEIISLPYESSGEIFKVSLRSSQNPSLPSDLASIKHFISEDDGISWRAIQPQQEEGTSGTVSTIPEIISFNDGTSIGVTTSLPVTSIRWKAILERNNKVFEDKTGSLYKTILPISELHDIPFASPHTFSLDQIPLEGTIKIVDPMYGSCGISRYVYHLGMGGEKTYFLPRWGDINSKRPMKKVSVDDLYQTESISDGEWLSLSVGNRRWEVATDSFDNYSPEDRVYSIDWNSENPSISFGDGTFGRTPLATESISLRFEAERIFPVNGSDTPASLAFPVAADKNMIVVKSYGEIENASVLVPKGQRIVRLAHREIQEVLTTFSGLTEKTFVNGVDEFSDDNEWSLDADNGSIYFSSANSTTGLNSVSYSFIPVRKLHESEWDWATTTSLHDSIKIKESAWETVPFRWEVSTLSLGFSSSTRVLHLPYLSVDKKSLVVTVSGETNPFFEEVNFVDGATELETLIQVTHEILSLTTAEPYTTFVLPENPASGTSGDIIFTEADLFLNRVFSIGSVSEAGDYFVDLTTDPVQVSIKLEADISDAGSVTYYKEGPNSEKGLFSVDYNNGILFTQLPIDPDTVSGLVVEGAWTDYRVEYPIARLIPPSNWKADLPNRLIKISNIEELFVSEAIAKTGVHKWQVNYDSLSESREDLRQLKEYFSPILKDYILKVVPRS